MRLAQYVWHWVLAGRGWGVAGVLVYARINYRQGTAGVSGQSENGMGKELCRPQDTLLTLVSVTLFEYAGLLLAKPPAFYTSLNNTVPLKL